MISWEVFVDEVRRRQLAPKHIEVSQWNSWYLVSAFDRKSSEYISESVSMGISRSGDLAFRKAFTEFNERRAIKESKDSNSKVTERTDGFAAYPFLDADSKMKARHHALNEAAERFLWATWWDNPETLFYRNRFKFEDEMSPFIDLAKQEFRLSSLEAFEIEDCESKFCLLILIGKNNLGGYFSGGACEQLPLNSKSAHSIFERAFGELLRHLLAFEKMKSCNEDLLGFYEKRLFGFGSGKFSAVVEKRLSLIGAKSVNLPRLLIDAEIDHNNSDSLVLYRCLFQEQPVFMGGAIDRFCI